MVDKSEKFRWLVRLGFAARGMVYLLVGILALVASRGQSGPEGAFDLMQNGTYTISPVKNNDVTVNNGITTLDIALIRRHILKIAGLDSPYKMLAADADNSSTITTTDLAAIRKVILTIDSFSPAGACGGLCPRAFHSASRLTLSPSGIRCRYMPASCRRAAARILSA